MEFFQCGNFPFWEPQNLVQNQDITLSGCKYFSGKVQAVFQIWNLFFLLLLCQILKCFFSLLKTKKLDLRLQPFDEADLLLLLTFQELYNEYGAALAGFPDCLTDCCCRLAFSISALDL